MTTSFVLHVEVVLLAQALLITVPAAPPLTSWIQLPIPALLTALMVIPSPNLVILLTMSAKVVVQTVMPALQQRHVPLVPLFRAYSGNGIMDFALKHAQRTLSQTPLIVLIVPQDVLLVALTRQTVQHVNQGTTLRMPHV